MPVFFKSRHFFLLFVMQKPILLILLLINLAAFSQSSYISLDQSTDVVENHKKVSNFVSIYYDQGKNTLIKHIKRPNEILIITNAIGEAKIYYPRTNKVTFRQMTELSSKNDLIYYFANNMTDHLGLADEGFKLSDRSYEENYMVTRWKAPSTMKVIDQVKMVFNQGVPIYAEYLTKEQLTTKKIYYRNYQDYYSFRMPSKIVEINYTSTGDSTVNRTVFSNVKVENNATSDYFNFKIPADAQPIQTK